MTAGLWGQVSVASCNGAEVQELEAEQAAAVTSEPALRTVRGLTVTSDWEAAACAETAGRSLFLPGVADIGACLSPPLQTLRPSARPVSSMERRTDMLLVPLSSSDSAEGFEGLVLSLINDSFF